MLFFFFQSLCSDTDIIVFPLLSHILRAKDHRRKVDVSTLYLAPLKYCIPFGRPKGLCLLSEYYTQGGRIG